MALRKNQPDTKSNFQPNRWKDVDLSFEKNPVTNDIKVIKDIDAIKQSIKNIVLTNPWDRPFRPDFGAGVRSLLFENLTPMLVLRLKKKIEFAIEKYEPRVLLNNVIVVGRLDGNAIEVTIQFTIRNSLTEESINISLSRLR